MKRITRQALSAAIVGVSLCLFVVPIAEGQTNRQPRRPVDARLKQRVKQTPTVAAPTLKNFTDSALLKSDRLRSKPISLDLTRKLKALVLPAALDYSKDVTLTRCQDGGGGCPGFTMLHITDIIKEWEHPFTPDLSFYYLDVLWLDWISSQAKAGKTWATISGDIPFFEKYGMASEGLCHSNYDLPTPIYADAATALYSKGDLIGWADKPSAAASEQAKLYRVKFSEPISLGTDTNAAVDAIKRMMFLYGPISAGGWWRSINSSLVEGHVVTLVGYDDNTRQFRYLNSWGDWWYKDDTHSYGNISYDEILKDNIDTLRYPISVPSDRTNTLDAFTARIRIQHHWRGELNVKIGVVGKPMITVWDTRGRRADRRQEWSGDLDIDVRLPDYAPSCWPPSTKNRWMLQVEDVDRNEIKGWVTEFTLARLKTNRNCRSLGRFTSEVYGKQYWKTIPKPADGPTWKFYDHESPGAPNPNPGILKISVPEIPEGGASAADDGKTPILSLPRPTYTIMLGQGTSSSGEVAPMAILTAVSALVPKPAPAPGAVVGLYELERNACINKPSVWVRRSSATTGADGKVVFNFTLPRVGKHIYAVALKDGETVLASSDAYTSMGETGRVQLNLAKPEIDLEFPDLKVPISVSRDIRTRERRNIR